MLTPTCWYLATAPIDLRCGADRLLVCVQSLFGHDALAGGVTRSLALDAHGKTLCSAVLTIGIDADLA